MTKPKAAKTATKATSTAKPPAKGKRVGGAKPGAPRHREKAPIDPETGEKGLTPGEEKFVALLVKGETQVQAYLDCFPQAKRWSRKTVDSKASVLAGKAKIQARFTEIMQAAARANEVDAAEVLREYLLRLRGDPRDLTEVRICPCRYCYGKGHLYQRTDGELAQERSRHETRQQERQERDMPPIGPFDEKGGGGYSKLLAPNRECPACAGAGEPQVVLKDSRTYSAGALALFGGVKETKEGIEVKVGDRDNALMQVARHVGFFEADNTRDVNVSVDVEALDAVYDEALARSKAAAEHARGRMGRIMEKAEAQAREAGLPVDGDRPGEPDGGAG